MLAALENRGGASEGGVGVLQLRGAVHGTAGLAGVTVLIFRAALGALTLHVAVWQEHALDGIEELLHRFGADEASLAQSDVNLFGELVVFGGIGGVPVIEADVKAVQVLLAVSGDIGHELLGCFASLLSGNHDRRAMGVVGTHEVHRVPSHALEPDPNIRLDVLHHVPHMKRGIGVGQGGGDEKLARGKAHGVEIEGDLWRSLILGAARQDRLTALRQFSPPAPCRPSLPCAKRFNLCWTPSQAKTSFRLNS